MLLSLLEEITYDAIRLTSADKSTGNTTSRCLDCTATSPESQVEEDLNYWLFSMSIIWRKKRRHQSILPIDSAYFVSYNNGACYRGSYRCVGRILICVGIGHLEAF